MAKPKGYGDWEVARFCAHCDKYLSRADFFDSYPAGEPTCIHCGVAGEFVLPTVNERVRRKHYTTGRRAAVEASRAQKNVFSFLWYHSIMLLRMMKWKKRRYTWEYQKKAS